ncbi:hypothetical protein PTKIN_Ptkin17bG0030100 [Pterospermum kingtungense]
MIVASYDTLATSIEWALSELLRHPRLMVRLQQELETIVGSNRMVEESDLPKLASLDMVLKESLRLHPILPLLLLRESMEDITINGYFIPKKSRIMLPDGMLPDELDMNEKLGLTLPRANHLFAKPTYRLLD